MCGIIGLFLKTSKLEAELGQHAAGMLQVMTDRGPDSAGFAVYNAVHDLGAAAQVKMTVRGDSRSSGKGLHEALSRAIDAPVEQVDHDDHFVLTLPAAKETEARQAISRISPDLRIVGVGAAMELFKGIGLPADVSARFDLPSMRGTHVIGHTRMATESAVTTAGAHPFSTGPDQCLVHNGSLSNHNALRRKLRREGLEFATENDTEVAAGYLSWRLAQGDRLDQALTSAIDDLDGFYTFVVGTKTGFGVLRDPVACKPAVMAETDDYVAFGSEYRALVDLPGIENAMVFEPEPRRVYFWQRAATGIAA